MLASSDGPFMIQLTSKPRQRYLVSFDPKRVPHRFTDVLVIGSGIAGVRRR